MDLLKNTKMFLVTANIASCFDQPKEMLDPWLDQLFKVVEEQKPDFIAIHSQEVGGKNYETSMENVGEFVRNILRRVTAMDYTRGRIFIDADYTLAENFTALGNLYFFKPDVRDVRIWDFFDKKFVECNGIEEYIGSIETVSIKQKSKFPQQFFPECKWSRKGFLRTRWCVNQTQIDLVNIHLFHDASNIIAMEQFPSVYSLNRKRAMEHTLDRFHNDEFNNVPMFIFGDFNFRVDTKSTVEFLTKDCSNEDSSVDGEKTRCFKNVDTRRLQLSVSKKRFEHYQHETKFMKENGKWLRPFDKELNQFSSRLFEFPISFPPSYPFEEGFESQDGKLYMKTRCPSWCDRIILSKIAKELVDKSNANVQYNIIGLDTRMGDHKPVCLQLELAAGSGIVECCKDGDRCINFVHDVDSECFSIGVWCRCLANPAICPDTPDSVCPDTPDSLSFNRSACPPSACVDHLPSDSSKRSSSHGDDDDDQLEDHHPDVEDALMMKSDDLMRGLLKLKNEDHQLKRVRSDPVKIRSCVEKLKNKEGGSSPLVHSQSLDGRKRTEIRLRLRTSSSRLISHHSSSSEEWFEEVPNSLDQENEEGRVDHHSAEEGVESCTTTKESSIASDERTEAARKDSCDIDDSISAILRTPKVIQHQNSMNNLLITDKSKCQFDTKSQGAISDDSSLKTDGASRVVPCPCTSENQRSSTVPLVVTEDQEKRSMQQCCCALS